MIHFAEVGTRIKNALLRRKSEEEESKCVPWMPALLRTALPPPGTTQPPRYIRRQVRVNPTRSSRVVELEVRKMEKSSLWYTSSPEPPREIDKDEEREKVLERAGGAEA
jgi:hypothetical protein